jgi:hypothetical protein
MVSKEEEKIRTAVRMSIAFTAGVVVNTVAVGRGKYTAWVGLNGAAPARLAPVHRSVLVRAPVCHQVAQRATHRLNEVLSHRQTLLEQAALKGSMNCELCDE